MSDRSGSNRLESDWLGSDRSGLDQSRSDQSGSDRSGSDRSGSDRSGSDRSDSDRPESIGWIRVGYIPDIRNGVTQHNFSGQIGIGSIRRCSKCWITLSPKLPDDSIQTVRWLPLVAINTEKCRCIAYSTPIRSICRKSKCWIMSWITWMTKLDPNSRLHGYQEWPSIWDIWDKLRLYGPKIAECQCL